MKQPLRYKQNNKPNICIFIDLNTLLMYKHNVSFRKK